jgi:hypothetical protein
VIPLGAVLQHLESSHPAVAMEDKIELLKHCIKDKAHVDFAKLEDTFSRHSHNFKPSEYQIFSVIANNISKRMGGSS